MVDCSVVILKSNIAPNGCSSSNIEFLDYELLGILEFIWFRSSGSCYYTDIYDSESCLIST
ncbi:unnamed protein product, partial [Cylicocyclus nassatus]